MKKTTLNLILLVLFIPVCFLCNSCKLTTKNTELITENSQNLEQENPYKDAEITAVIIPSEENTFGYDIYVYGTILIHQPSRPGLSGNKGFATEEDALIVTELVIKKMRNNEMPPTVTTQELQELGVL
ncbi:MAG: DUF4907 domain-containing protein [Bacteroidetes bacterium]|nr:DUF4907 domain-containing protein [Bacteroidota bacterium]MCL2302224.1 DUF4907 domain-containing protein [Lentimicrobiaceae bacterium]MCL2302304.1 DUF4907 domain-containing protein [Lentimicrobiaceae bacterium]